MLSTRLQGIKGSETVWSVRIRTDAPPGRVPLVLRAIYADGKSVAVHEALTVVPAAETSSFPWVAVAAGVLIAMVLAGALLGLARRRTG